MTDLRTPLCDLLGSKYPIIQTAMGWVADAKLVAATCNAGGFGFLAAATIEADALEPEILKAKSLTDKPFGINFHMFQPNAADVVDLAIKHRLRAVSYGRGPDAKTIGRFKAAGIICMPTVGALKHATKAVEIGADVVTVQGQEGGGHTGNIPTTILLPQVLDAVKVPVVAAGGFFDGRGLAAALAYGAAGIAMGTRFLMTSDSPVPPATLDRYVKVKDPAAVRVSRAIDGMPQRMIDNEELRRVESQSSLARMAMSIRYGLDWGKQTGMTYGQMFRLIAKSLTASDMSFFETVMAANAPTIIRKAIVFGDPVNGVLPGGQAAAAIDRLESCAELIERLVREANGRIDALSRLRAGVSTEAGS
jgi:nitronate monooxygenase